MLPTCCSAVGCGLYCDIEPRAKSQARIPRTTFAPFEDFSESTATRMSEGMSSIPIKYPQDAALQPDTAALTMPLRKTTMKNSDAPQACHVVFVVPRWIEFDELSA